jgi:cytochrome c
MCVLVFSASAASSNGRLAGTTGGTSIGIEAGQQAGNSQTVWDGVYTDAQADRGKRVYGRSCEYCHGPDLGGNTVGEIPPLALDPFQTTWRGRSVKDLFDRVSRSMPHDNPGSLSPQSYIDVVSYLLAANEFPSGKIELDVSADRLGRILITKAPAAR